MLESIFHELNRVHFSGELPLPSLSWNSRLRSTAGRFCPGSRNPIRPREPQIEVAEYLKELSDGELHIRDTLLHEMIHYQLWHQKKPYGHNAEFYRIMNRVGAKRFNPVPKLAPVKYWYACPHCEVKVPARRRLGEVACLPCCKRYNDGFFTKRFVLKIWTGSTPQAPKADAPKLNLSAEEIIRRLEELKNAFTKRRNPRQAI